MTSAGARVKLGTGPGPGPLMRACGVEMLEDLRNSLETGYAAGQAPVVEVLEVPAPLCDPPQESVALRFVEDPDGDGLPTHAVTINNLEMLRAACEGWFERHGPCRVQVTLDVPGILEAKLLGGLLE